MDFYAKPKKMKFEYKIYKNSELVEKGIIDKGGADLYGLNWYLEDLLYNLPVVVVDVHIDTDFNTSPSPFPHEQSWGFWDGSYIVLYDIDNKKQTKVKLNAGGYGDVYAKASFKDLDGDEWKIEVETMEEEEGEEDYE